MSESQQTVRQKVEEWVAQTGGRKEFVLALKENLGFRISPEELIAYTEQLESKSIREALRHFSERSNGTKDIILNSTERTRFTALVARGKAIIKRSAKQTKNTVSELPTNAKPRIHGVEPQVAPETLEKEKIIAALPEGSIVTLTHAETPDRSVEVVVTEHSDQGIQVWFGDQETTIPFEFIDLAEGTFILVNSGESITFSIENIDTGIGDGDAAPTPDPEIVAPPTPAPEDAAESPQTTVDPGGTPDWLSWEGDDEDHFAELRDDSGDLIAEKNVEQTDTVEQQTTPVSAEELKKLLPFGTVFVITSLASQDINTYKYVSTGLENDFLNLAGNAGYKLERFRLTPYRQLVLQDSNGSFWKVEVQPEKLTPLLTDEAEKIFAPNSTVHIRSVNSSTEAEHTVRKIDPKRNLVIFTVENKSLPAHQLYTTTEGKIVWLSDVKDRGTVEWEIQVKKPLTIKQVRRRYPSGSRLRIPGISREELTVKHDPQKRDQVLLVDPAGREHVLHAGDLVEDETGAFNYVATGGKYEKVEVIETPLQVSPITLRLNNGQSLTTGDEIHGLNVSVPYKILGSITATREGFGAKLQIPTTYVILGLQYVDTRKYFYAIKASELKKAETGKKIRPYIAREEDGGRISISDTLTKETEIQEIVSYKVEPQVVEPASELGADEPELLSTEAERQQEIASLNVLRWSMQLGAPRSQEELRQILREAQEALANPAYDPVSVQNVIKSIRAILGAEPGSVSDGETTVLPGAAISDGQETPPSPEATSTPIEITFGGYNFKVHPRLAEPLAKIQVDKVCLISFDPNGELQNMETVSNWDITITQEIFDFLKIAGINVNGLTTDNTAFITIKERQVTRINFDTYTSEVPQGFDCSAIVSLRGFSIKRLPPSIVLGKLKLLHTPELEEPVSLDLLDPETDLELSVQGANRPYIKISEMLFDGVPITPQNAGNYEYVGGRVRLKERQGVQTTVAEAETQNTKILRSLEHAFGAGSFQLQNIEGREVLVSTQALTITRQAPHVVESFKAALETFPGQIIIAEGIALSGVEIDGKDRLVISGETKITNQSNITTVLFQYANVQCAGLSQVKNSGFDSTNLEVRNAAVEGVFTGGYSVEIASSSSSVTNLRSGIVYTGVSGISNGEKILIGTSERWRNEQDKIKVKIIQPIEFFAADLARNDRNFEEAKRLYRIAVETYPEHPLAEAGLDFIFQTESQAAAAEPAEEPTPVAPEAADTAENTFEMEKSEVLRQIDELVASIESLPEEIGESAIFAVLAGYNNKKRNIKSVSQARALVEEISELVRSNPTQAAINKTALINLLTHSERGVKIVVTNLNQ